MNFKEFEKSVKEILPHGTIRDVKMIYEKNKPISLDKFIQIILKF